MIVDVKLLLFVNSLRISIIEASVCYIEKIKGRLVKSSEFGKFRLYKVNFFPL